MLPYEAPVTGSVPNGICLAQTSPPPKDPWEQVGYRLGQLTVDVFIVGVIVVVVYFVIQASRPKKKRRSRRRDDDYDDLDD